MSKEKFKNFKDYPEGSVEKRIYDSYFLNPEDYLLKYFSKNQLENFNSFYQEYICPILKKDERELYIELLKKKKPPFFINYKKFDEFNTTKRLRDKYSDIELFNFLSFLYSVSNQFDSIEKFLGWLNNKEYLMNLKFDDILNYRFGNNYLKHNLMMLPILSSNWI